jgi:transcriptional regulator with XRE-family HTH domain
MYSIFEMLCEKNGVTPYKVGKETKIATSTLSDWKNGKSKPKQDKLKLIADYFDVSVDFLMTGENLERPDPARADILADIAMDPQLLEYVSKIKNMSAEKKKQLYFYIDFLLERKDEE